MCDMSLLIGHKKMCTCLSVNLFTTLASEIQYKGRSINLDPLFRGFTNLKPNATSPKTSPTNPRPTNLNRKPKFSSSNLGIVGWY